MRYQLPQFIETEVKLIGPFTLRQFLWLGGGGALLFVLFMTMPFSLFIILAIPIGGVSAALAFAKVEGMPLINYIAAILAYTLNPKKYLFQQEKAADTLPYSNGMPTIK